MQRRRGAALHAECSGTPRARPSQTEAQQERGCPLAAAPPRPQQPRMEPLTTGHNTCAEAANASAQPSPPAASAKHPSASALAASLSARPPGYIPQEAPYAGPLPTPAARRVLGLQGIYAGGGLLVARPVAAERPGVHVGRGADRGAQRGHARGAALQLVHHAEAAAHGRRVGAPAVRLRARGRPLSGADAGGRRQASGS